MTESRETDFTAEGWLLRGRSGTTALLAQRVIDTSWNRRARAVAYLGWIRAEEAVPALERVLQHDPDSGPRIQALDALCAIEPERAVHWALSLSTEPEPLGGTARSLVKDGCGECLRLHWWNAFVKPPH